VSIWSGVEHDTCYAALQFSGGAYLFHSLPPSMALVTLTLDKVGNGVRIEQGFDGIWDAQGLRKLAAALKGAAEMLEA
jgi:hypothetical protein